MPYDSNLDETLHAESWGTEDERITVSIRSYNKGMKKLQITRESKNAQGEMRFAKLGRLTKEESEAILPMIKEAVTHMG